MTFHQAPCEPISYAAGPQQLSLCCNCMCDTATLQTNLSTPALVHPCA